MNIIEQASECLAQEMFIVTAEGKAGSLLHMQVLLKA
jgi:hypothetical protein